MWFSTWVGVVAEIMGVCNVDFSKIQHGTDRANDAVIVRVFHRRGFFGNIFLRV